MPTSDDGPVRCPACGEERLVEAVETAGRRAWVCLVCSATWREPLQAAGGASRASHA